MNVIVVSGSPKRLQAHGDLRQSGSDHMIEHLIENIALVQLLFPEINHHFKAQNSDMKVSVSSQAGDSVV